MCICMPANLPYLVVIDIITSKLGPGDSAPAMQIMINAPQSSASILKVLRRNIQSQEPHF